MHQRIFINTLILLFTTLFILIRIGSFHGLSHLSDDDDTVIHCELCDVLLQVEHQVPVDVLHQIPTSLRTIYTKFKENPQTIYTAPVLCYVLPDFVFNKPPPVV